MFSRPSAILALSMEGNSNPCLVIEANDEDSKLFSADEVVGISPDDPGCNPLVNALSDGGKPI